ncbi:uncharacterized protein [Cicer arietinum]|uniref:La-related protein 6B-like n=1 Tax=Cicer arietinum TaxID=3827 RepID=A0A3Q7X4V2_CICAR|nr:la-related protein 6B-like [Cicer arietinum]
MAQESLTETPVISSNTLSQTDSSLSRSVSFSRLNAQAPEFVPTRPTPRTDLQQQPRPVLLPPPSPPSASGMVHVYSPSPSSPFHIPIRGHVPVANHHHHRHHHVPVHYRSHHHPHQYHVSSDSAVQQPQQSHVEPDHTPFKSKHSGVNDLALSRSLLFVLPADAEQLRPIPTQVAGKVISTAAAI